MTPASFHVFVKKMYWCVLHLEGKSCYVLVELVDKTKGLTRYEMDHGQRGGDM
jgi:hypothetical protein